jgi:hypothetical protein
MEQAHVCLLHSLGGEGRRITMGREVDAGQGSHMRCLWAATTDKAACAMRGARAGWRFAREGMMGMMGMQGHCR